jgi:2-polyprenyl-6-methoxyphenol hydroxylase-like FAD-dependent oxidoreductase
MMSEKTALIIGAGVGGLTTAYWLNGIGWQTLVIERAEDLRSGGYMLGLSGAGYDVARRMGILDQLHAGSRPVRENSYRDDSGREVLRLRYGDFLAGLDWVTLPRNTLVESLRGTLGEGTEIRFGTTLTAAIDQGDAVEATLSDGSTLRCDLLIGADGVHSATRQLLFGAEEKYASHLGYRFAAFQVENILGLGEDFVSYVAPGRTVEFYTLSNGRLATLYAWRSVATGQVPATERRELLRTAFANAHPDALRIIDQLPADEGMAFDELTLIEMPRWRKGRFLLLGDAAHCLTLISGQGAAMAMTSACLLAEELGKSGSTIDAALDRHEERLRPTIAGLQQRSRKTAAWFIPASRWGFRLRNLVMRIAPKRFLTSYFQKAIRSEIALAVIDRTDTP